jgi:hypothetical protein
VQAAAAAVEKRLRERSPPDATNPALEQLSAVLDPFLARLRAALAVGAPGTVAAPASDPAHIRAVAEQLRKLLTDFDTSAVAFTEENQACLRPAFDAATWDEFLRLIQGFAFADAQALLDQALARLPCLLTCSTR